MTLDIYKPTDPRLCPNCHGKLIIRETLIYKGESISAHILDESVIKERENDPAADWVEVVCCPECGYIEVTDDYADEEDDTDG